MQLASNAASAGVLGHLRLGAMFMTRLSRASAVSKYDSGRRLRGQFPNRRNSGRTGDPVSLSSSIRRSASAAMRQRGIAKIRAMPTAQRAIVRYVANMLVSYCKQTAE